MRRGILSLCDYTGVMVLPWVRDGHHAYLVDPQHPGGTTHHLLCGCDHVYPEELGRYGCPNCEGDYEARGQITKIGHEVDHPLTWAALRTLVQGERLAFVAGFPVCTQLAISGTSRWAEKRKQDPHFQARAMQLVHETRVVGELSGAPYFFENPVSAISSIYRKPDYTFHPYEYGGYLPADDVHPFYPDYFPPRDAYGKRTCLWAGGGFQMPPKRPVNIAEGQDEGQGQSRAHNRLGGKSERTKNIRSATPRGFSQAVFETHNPSFVEASFDLEFGT